MNTRDDNMVCWPDNAVAQRLARLRSRPLDMTALRRRVQDAISERSPSRRPMVCFNASRAIAASLIVAAVIAALMMTSGGPVLASASELSRIHHANGLGTREAVAVDSIESAGRVLAKEWKDCPRLPGASGTTVVRCHVDRLSGKSMACLALMVDGQSVTLAVAHAADIQVPECPSVTRAGIKYHIQSSGNVNIVTTQRDGLWLCLMGELAIERLVDTAASLRI